MPHEPSIRETRGAPHSVVLRVMLDVPASPDA